MTDIAIRVENLSKQYHIGGPSTGLRTGPQARYKTIRESLTEAVTGPLPPSIVRRPWSTVQWRRPTADYRRYHLGP